VAEDLEDNNTNPALRLHSVTGFFQFKMKQLILSLGLIFIISSCDPGVHFERIIVNQSSHDVWVKVNQEVYPDFIEDSILIKKNSYSIVSARSGIGRVDDLTNCGFPEGTLSSGVITNDTLQVQKDLNTNENWVIAVLKKNLPGGGECECRFTITDSDIK
jgi:hypothetical protein